jgi:hypothetical protein
MENNEYINSEIEKGKAALRESMEADLKAPKQKYRVYMVLKSGYEMCIDTELTNSTAKRVSKLSLTKVQFNEGDTVHTIRLEEVAYINVTELKEVDYILDSNKEEAMF